MQIHTLIESIKMSARKTTQQFIQEAEKVHGTEYDYDLVDYQGQREFVTITCRCHGNFQQRPKQHLRGSGCQVCGKDKNHDNTRKTNEQFIEEAKAKHGNRYDYSETDYLGADFMVDIICKEHGKFTQTPYSHLKSKTGCRDCAVSERKLSDVEQRKQAWIDNCTITHNNFYSYEKVVYVNQQEKVMITCPNHGDFLQAANNHSSGSGCQQCKTDKLRSCFIGTKEGWLKKAIAKHGDRYDYSKVIYDGIDNPVTIVCSKHGEFKQKPYDHQVGKGCTKCGDQKASEKKTLQQEDVIERFIAVHGDEYDYSKVVYLSTQKSVEIICSKHGSFIQAPENHFNGQRCPKCATTTPLCELEILEFLESLDIEVVSHDRKQINPYELDFYLPEYNIAIEHCGLYWHQEDKLGAQYHVKKLKLCQDKGIRLLQIFEDEWLTKRDAIETIIKGALGKVDKVHGRKTKVEFQRPISQAAKDFVAKNHHSGNTLANSGVVLKENGVIVYVATFRKHSNDRKTFIDGEWELARVTSTKRVVGGLSRCIKAFKRENEVSKIVTFCDLRFFTGNGYEAAGFDLSHITAPTPYYANNRAERVHQRAFTKAKTIKLFGDQYPTAKAAVLDQGYWRIFDAGHKKYVWSEID